MSDLSRAEFESRMSAVDQNIDRGFDRICQRLDVLNGRVRETEVGLAVEQGRSAAIRSVATRSGAIVAAVVSSEAAAIFSFFGGREW